MNIYKKNILTIIALIVFLFANVFHVYLFRNTIDQSELPVRYKSYKAFQKTTVSSLNYEIIKLRGSWGDVDSFEEPIFLEKSEFVVLHANAKSNSQRAPVYYKLDKNGEVVDSIPDINSYKIRNGYLMTKDAYSTWMIDGDTLNHKYIDINMNAGESEKIKTEFERLRNKAVSIAYFDSDVLWKYDSKNHENEIDKAVFLIDGKWYALYGKDLDLPIYRILSEEKEKVLQSKFTHLLRADYFHKTELKGREISEWEVNAYFTFIKEKDTLKIFQEMDLNGENADLFLTYYTSKNINFYLILGDYAESYYIIKPIIRK